MVALNGNHAQLHHNYTAKGIRTLLSFFSLVPVVPLEAGALVVIATAAGAAASGRGVTCLEAPLDSALWFSSSCRRSANSWLSKHPETLSLEMKHYDKKHKYAGALLQHTLT